MTENSTDFRGEFPALPIYRASWLAVYMEPIVQSGERLTIGVVAFDGKKAIGELAISQKALECLYGEASYGMAKIMQLALDRALTFAEKGFEGEFYSGIHGISLGSQRSSLGANIEDILSQALSLSSSLCSIHSDDDVKTDFDLGIYWLRLQKEMRAVSPGLVHNFGKSVDVEVLGSSISLPCDYFSSRIAANICRILPTVRPYNLFDIASSRILRLEQLQQHQCLMETQQRPIMMLVTPTEAHMEKINPSVRQSFNERILLLRDMADKKEFLLEMVSSSRQGAIRIRDLEIERKNAG